MEILEGQVVIIQNEVSDIETDVDFLFDEQVIQDERLLNLEEETNMIDTELDIIDDELNTIDDEVEGIKIGPSFYSTFRNSENMLNFFNIIFTGLQDTTLALDFRVTMLEENGGDGGNSFVAELEVRVETLEGITTDHETRISATKSDVTGRYSVWC